MEAFKNPWIELKNNIVFHSQSNSYILKQEREIIRDFNNSVGEEYRIHEEIYPSPFIGNVHTAKVMLLLLNPGYDPAEQERGFYTKYNDLNLEELIHGNSKLDLPLFSLGEKYKEDSPYWYKKLRPLHSKVGVKAVAENLCKIQFFPYVTEKFKPIPKKLIGKHLKGQEYLNTQLYSFSLVKEAIKRNSIIIITRGKNLWLEAIPELKTYSNVHYTVNPRTPSISLKNCPIGFPLIEKALSQI